MICVELDSVSARGAAERGRPRPTLGNVSLRASSGVLAIIGTHRDGTSLLFDLIDGSARPSRGTVTVLGGSADAARARVSRVSLDAPLPAGLRVDQLCDLASELRSEPRRPAVERLAVLGIAALAKRRVETLGVAERRTVTLAIALTSSSSEVILVEEPLVELDPVAPRFVADALRERGAATCIVLATASPREAARLADRLGVVDNGTYRELDLEHLHVALEDGNVAIRVVLAPSIDKTRTAAWIAALTNDDAVTAVEATSNPSRSLVAKVSGRDQRRLAHAITRAIADAGVDVELIEPSALSADAIGVVPSRGGAIASVPPVPPALASVSPPPSDPAGAA